jgi:hypothetical protein
MLWKQGYWDQITFVRDKINQLFYTTYEKFKNNPVIVINTHMSKSIVLPVYEINLEHYGLKMIIRNNFYNWKISVISNKHIETDFMNLFQEDEIINPIYCEGFKEEQVFGSYKDNNRQFTIEIRDEYQLYTFMYLLNNYFKSK